MALHIVQIKKKRCVGCGLCTERCPRGAIRLVGGCAEIDLSRCDRCGTCIDICPQQAVVMLVPASADDLKAMLDSLMDKTGVLINAIETLQKGHRR